MPPVVPPSSAASPVPSSSRAFRGAAALASALLLCLASGCGGGGGASGGQQAATGTGAGTSTGSGSTTGGTGGGTTAGTGSTGDATITGIPLPPVTGGGTDTAGGGSTGTGTGTGTDAGTGSTGAPSTPLATGGGSTYVVGNGTLPTGALRVAALTDVPWSTLPAGSVVLVSPGSYAGVTTITAVGTAANPIVVTALDTANPPTLTESVDFQHAAYVQVSHVVVQQPTYAGFVIRLGSSHITVSDSTIDRAPAGIAITGAAGTAHQLLRNTITDSATDGIGVEVNADPAQRTLIQRNTILRSGQHGIEVRASHYQVEYNTVTASGQAGGGGTSGIHVYSGSPGEDSGDDNWIRYNLSYANTDRVAADGNGIEVDQWCDGNVVAFNQTWGNDGAGIIVYDGSRNTIQNNTTWNDGADSGGTHVGVAELAITGTSTATVNGNRVFDNLSFSTRAGVPALYVDTTAVAAGGNVVGPNMLWNGAAGMVLRWTDSSTKQTAAAVDAATGTTGNLVAAPAFTNTGAPAAGGLKLAAMPALAGVMPTGLADAANAAPAAGDAFFGAFYTAP